MKINQLVEAIEQGSKNLVIFDIDDTLLHTTAKIRVIKNGQVVAELDNQQFNQYQLKPGEEFDFGEFRSAEKFNQESQPIEPMIKKLKDILAHSTTSDVIMLTARADFDNRDLFLKTFTDLGIDMSRVYVHRAGNLPGNQIPAEKKAAIVRQYADSRKYYKIVLYDDSRTNLAVFKNLKSEYPNVDFRAYYVNPQGQTQNIAESISIKDHKENFVEMFKKFLPVAMKYIKLDHLPTMKFEANIHDDVQPTFGKYENGEHVLHVALMNRHPNDILRTIAHELTHYKQDTEHQLDADSGRTGSPIENEAHALAGIVMRHFNKRYPEYLSSKPITESMGIDQLRDLAASKMGYRNYLEVPPRQLPTFNKVLQDIQSNPPTPMTPQEWRRHQQAIQTRSMNQKAVDWSASHWNPDEEMPENINQSVPSEVERIYNEYLDAIDNSTIDPGYLNKAKEKVKELIRLGYAPNRFGQLQKTGVGVVGENFADGKHPGRKGLAKRSGVNTKASISSLRKTAKHSTGEKARMAHWLANIKSGRAKKKK
jgi:hypothetical protein